MDDSQDLLVKLGFSLMSAAFLPGAPIPSLYTCKGQNINPPLTVSNVPAEAKSLALILHDPDALNGDFVHWLMWDISVLTAMIAANSLPDDAIQGTNDAGQNNYFGPCPPTGTGTHHYIFELFALDKMLDLPPGSNRYQLEQAMAGHILAKTVLTGLFVSQP